MGFPIDFESKFGDHTGTLDACVVWEEAPEKESEMISLEQSWGIRASWTTSGILLILRMENGK